MKKRWIWTVLLLIGLLSFCACGTPEVDEGLPEDPAGFEYIELADGTLSVIGYNGTAIDLVLDSYADRAITRIEGSAFAGNASITSVKLGANVTEIGVAAFADCAALTKVDAGESAISRIGNAAFLGCGALSEVILPTTVTNIGVDAFLACDGLTRAEYLGTGEAWATVLLGNHNEALSDCLVTASGSVSVDVLAEGQCTSAVSWSLDKTGLLTVKGEGRIPDYDPQNNPSPWAAYALSIRAIHVTEGVDIVGKCAFFGCSKLEKVMLDDSVRLIDDNAFYNCVKLNDMVLPSNLRRIGSGTFYGCEDLTAVVIPDTVTHVGSGAFMNCEMLTSVTLSSALTGLEQWTFSGCTKLTSVVLPESIVEVGVGAFYRCMSVKEITLGGGGEVTVDKNAFGVCGSLVTVYFRGELSMYEDLVKVESGNNYFLSATVKKAD